MDHKMFTWLYDTLVNYGSSLWGTKQQQYISNVQNKECKFYLWVNGNTSNVTGHGDMDLLSSLRQQHMHLQNHPDDKTCQIVHKQSKHRTGWSW